MTDYTAQIKAKGLDSTGVTEDIARQLYSNLGRHEMFIVEGRVDARTEGNDGTHKVQLSLTLVEPAVNAEVAEHLRELARTLYQNRALSDGQLAIDHSLDDEPTVDQVVNAGAKHRPHPFLPDDAAKDTPICDVCGFLQEAAVHAEIGDPFSPPATAGNTDGDPEDQGEGEQDPEDDPED